MNEADQISSTSEWGRPDELHWWMTETGQFRRSFYAREQAAPPWWKNVGWPWHDLRCDYGAISIHVIGPCLYMAFAMQSRITLCAFLRVYGDIRRSRAWLRLESRHSRGAQQLHHAIGMRRNNRVTAFPPGISWPHMDMSESQPGLKIRHGLSGTWSQTLLHAGWPHCWLDNRLHW